MKTATSGFTLMETLFVLLIISILTLMAGNAWHALQQRMEARAAVALIASSLYAARNAAITRQMPVSICGSRNGLACDGQWQSGIMAFVDSAATGVPSSPQRILGFYRMPSSNARVTWQAFGMKNLLRYDNMGRTSASNGSFTYCPGNRDAALARQIVLNRGGRVRFSLDRDGDGIHEDSSGKALRCP
jgi:type IV fimbrial biogenesis protein FimT